MLDPPVELSEELTVKAVVEKILTYQAVLLHFENDSIDSSEPMKLARVGSTHGKRAKAVAQQYAAQTCAERPWWGCARSAAGRSSTRRW